LPRLTERLVSRGFSEQEIRKILGLNWMRVYREVWGG
jgi:membrane dipeptidase